MKPLCVIQGPYATRSGYGDFARDIVRHIIALDKYDVKLISTPWGGCPMNALEVPRDEEIVQRTMLPPFQLPRQPELYIQISVPGEFQPVGKYNIGITAGIETTLLSVEWIEGCNRMDVIFTISDFSRKTIVGTVAQRANEYGQPVGELKVVKPVEVLHNCVNTDIFKRLEPKEVPKSIKDELAQVTENFSYLFVGHWLKGDFGEDRKNVAMLIKVFGETFKNLPAKSRPALILKTSGAGFSYMDRRDILQKISHVRDTVGKNCPNVYLLHGDLTEVEMNGLYNHPKVKAHVSFTKGEGFGRPLLEATLSYKPVIASNWSGHLDFLNEKDAVLVEGELRQIEPGAVWPGVLIPESSWFNVDPQKAGEALFKVFKNYERHRERAFVLAGKNKKEFSFEAIQKKTDELLTKYVPEFALPVDVQLPALKRNV
jgi:glycosyltransferase involved in cell wall biosynthesis